MPRFDILYANFASLKRYSKDNAYWYQQIIQHNDLAGESN